MKKNKLILSLIVLTIFASNTVPLKTYAQEDTETPTVTKAPSPSPTPEKGSAMDKIRILKDKVATKVAELRQTEKKGITGLVDQISDTEMTLQAGNDKVTVNFTEDTPLFSITGKKEEGDFKDIDKGTVILALGYYDKDQKILDGRTIYIINQKPMFLLGKIADIDRENYTVTVKGKDGKDSIVDIETYSRTFAIGDKNSTVKSGFSKLSIGDLIQMIGTPNAKEDNRYSANRILVIESKTEIPTPTPTEKP